MSSHLYANVEFMDKQGNWSRPFDVDQFLTLDTMRDYVREDVESDVADFSSLTLESKKLFSYSVSHDEEAPNTELKDTVVCFSKDTTVEEFKAFTKKLGQDFYSAYASVYVMLGTTTHSNSGATLFTGYENAFNYAELRYVPCFNGTDEVDFPIEIPKDEKGRVDYGKFKKAMAEWALTQKSFDEIVKYYHAVVDEQPLRKVCLAKIANNIYEFENHMMPWKWNEEDFKPKFDELVFVIDRSDYDKKYDHYTVQQIKDKDFDCIRKDIESKIMKLRDELSAGDPEELRKAVRKFLDLFWKSGDGMLRDHINVLEKALNKSTPFTGEIEEEIESLERTLNSFKFLHQLCNNYLSSAYGDYADYRVVFAIM